jgi:hypothetical protein
MAQDDNEQAQGGGENAEQGEGGALDVQSTVDYALEMIQDQVKAHPVRTLGIAAGIGYVLGGGVPKLLVRLGMVFAGRMLTDAIATEGLRSLQGNLMGESEDAADDKMNAQPRAKNGHHRKRGQGERQARRE